MRPESFSNMKNCFGLSLTLGALLILLSKADDEVAYGTVQLNRLSSLYFPYDYNQTARYALEKGAAEQSSYDAVHQMVYSVAEDGILHVSNISDPTNPEIIFHITLPMIPTDVEVCGDIVAVSMEPSVRVSLASVVVYKIFDPQVGMLEKIQEFEVGAEPDMLTMNRNCTAIFVANEGEPSMNATGGFEDPEGSVTVIKCASSDFSGACVTTTINFTQFNSLADEYVARGVRWIYHGENSGSNTTFSQDLEPEYIALSDDESKAYIILQENNAMAVLDIITLEWIDIFPLGYKQWNSLEFDASDRDSNISFSNWPVYGMYQPDTIQYFTHNGEGYIITANEGDAKEYEPADTGIPVEWSEETRCRKLINELSPSVSQQLKTYLGDDKYLGRLKVSAVDGKDLNGNYRKFFAYGARSFSIWKASDMSRVYDSDADIEIQHAKKYPKIFNGQMGDLLTTPFDSFDARSDDKGPEVEALDVCKAGNKTIFVICNERISSIMLYSLTDDFEVKFESIYRPGGLNGTWQQLYDDRNIGDIDPEDCRCISAEDSPNGKPLVMVSGSVSGTLSLYEIEILLPEESNQGNTTTDSGAIQAAAISLTGMIAVLVATLL
nr:shell protein 2A [Novocrania anomala]